MSRLIKGIAFKMRYYICIVIALFACLPLEVLSQTIIFPDNYGAGKKKWSGRNVVDTAKWEVVYAHVSVDPVKDKRQADYELLSVGDKFIWYGGYGDFQMDSLINDNPEKYIKMDLTEYNKILRSYEPISTEMLYNRSDRILTYQGSVSPGEVCKYEEVTPEIDWALHDEVIEIMGYECFKATAVWRGREWTAWYCDIPESSGPWKFNGLPGLILQISDSKDEQLFQAIEIKKIEYPIGLTRRSSIKTTREKFNMTLKNFCENAGDFIVRSGMIKDLDDTDGKYKNYRKFFSPIELE